MDFFLQMNCFFFKILLFLHFHVFSCGQMFKAGFQTQHFCLDFSSISLVTLVIWPPCYCHQLRHWDLSYLATHLSGCLTHSVGLLQQMTCELHEFSIVLEHSFIRGIVFHFKSTCKSCLKCHAVAEWPGVWSLAGLHGCASWLSL